MRGKVAKAIRKEARKVAAGPTMWRRVNQQTRIQSFNLQDGTLYKKEASAVICVPNSFRDCVKTLKLEKARG